MRLNHGGLRLGIAVALAMAGGSAWGEQPSSTEDLKTEKQVQAKLQKDSDLKDNTIDVWISHGAATLTGTVDTSAEREKAVRITRAEGIARVDNQLKVASQTATGAATDDAVTADVYAKYQRDDTLRHTDIGVTTTNGVVTLNGSVQSDDERQRALGIARRATGVKRVEDKLQVIEASRPPLGSVPK
jgi:hyperosmotically inducible periplasmic protein